MNLEDNDEEEITDFRFKMLNHMPMKNQTLKEICTEWGIPEVSYQWDIIDLEEKRLVRVRYSYNLGSDVHKYLRAKAEIPNRSDMYIIEAGKTKGKWMDHNKKAIGETKVTKFLIEREIVLKQHGINDNLYLPPVEIETVFPSIWLSEELMKWEKDLLATQNDQYTEILCVLSCCVSSWAECSDSGAAGVPGGGVRGPRGGCSGEWCSFWASYNSSVSGVGRYYDQCPTPYRTDTLDLADFEFTDGTRKRSPDNVEVINNIIRHQGLTLTARETQSIIKCAHLLGNVLATAIDRRSEPRVDQPAQPEQPARSNMTLDLKETTIPLEVKEEKTCETATTQTDISLPNTRSAPRIFENILRQLSRSSIDVDKIESKDKTQVKPDGKGDAAEAKEPRGDVIEAKGDAGEAQIDGDAQANVTSEAKNDNSSQVSDVKKEE
ncbi:uncharacterized protein LOC135119186 [Helicoverpa armigera]|uniref:uncharacterized protein LOC135119186 n=1 Tax=Helicoverpa armigera TaxID=29058 RepID=UPI0030831A4A